MSEVISLLKDLNKPQREAVCHMNGPLLVIAGAGAGKTRVITCRIAYLISKGIDPRNILAVTFTNKAASEMKNRIQKLLNYELRITNYELLPTIGTFHSVCAQILRENANKAGLTKNYTILDKEDTLKIIKKCLKELNINPKQFQPPKMQSLISRQKSQLIKPERYTEDAQGDFFPETLSSIWNEYERHLKNQKSVDFDDLISKTVYLFEDNPDVLEKYQTKWKYILVDEYQDTNRAQYALTKLLAKKNKNICVVGDEDQCLLPQTKISTTKGQKSISKIKQGDKVLTAAGNGNTCYSKVKRVKKRFYKGTIINLHTQDNKKIKLTPHHVLFSQLAISAKIHYVYLMFRKDKGFRVGTAKGKRKFAKYKSEIGLWTRSRQEKADKMWVLKICKNKKEAQYWEHYFSFYYGIPTTVFSTNGRKMEMKQKTIDKLFKNIPTEKRAHNLLFDLNMSPCLPHFIPQGTVRDNWKTKRIKVRLAMLDDKRKSLISPWGLSRLSINTTDKSLRNKLAKNGFKTRKGKNKDWRLEITRLDCGKIEKILKQLTSIYPDLEISKTARLTKSGKFSLQTAGQLHPSMKIARLKNKNIYEDKIKNIELENYEGPVYDLDVENTLNYIANGLVVHNSIYAFRGADFGNILNFEKDWPNTKVIMLEQNYRSTQNILAAANSVIGNNKMRKPKNLFSCLDKGSSLSIIDTPSEKEEAYFVATKSGSLIASGIKHAEIAVLYRANFQSRIIEEAFLAHNISYQVVGTRFYHRKEIKDVLSYIKLALNPEDILSLERVVSEPPKGIGKISLVKYLSGREKTPSRLKKIKDFFLLVDKLGKILRDEKLSKAILELTKKCGYWDYLNDGTEEGQMRLDNIKELITLSTKYDHFEDGLGAQKLLEEVALMSEQDTLDKKEGSEKVRLMTVHAAKGLEFSHVFLVGLEDGLFPYMNFVKKDEEEEERRLFYVAMTRAKEQLFLSFAYYRNFFGQKQINKPSRFISEIPEELFSAEDEFTSNKEDFEQAETNYLEI